MEKTKQFLIAIISLIAGEIMASGCPQIDKTMLDQDGIPFCPDAVKDNAYKVTRCAYAQAKKWKPSNVGKRSTMKILIQALKDEAPVAITETAANLDLQVCRQRSEGDSFLLLYTKKGVTDYSGPFIMYREGGKTSNVVIHSPHDGQDGTHASTKAAFANSNALALISNGHPRRLSGEDKGPFKSDWAHKSQDLGYTAFLAFRDKFPESIHLHIHGVSRNKLLVTDSVGWDTKHALRGGFIAAADKAIAGTKFETQVWKFNGWITGIAMTRGPKDKGRKDNERWVGAEVPVAIHKNTQILTKIVRNFEEDYLKKPRPVTVDLEKEVPALDEEVDLVDEETDAVPEPTVPVVSDTECSNSDDESDLDIEVPERPATPAPAPSPTEPKVEPITYAPYPKPLQGTKALACVGVSYTNKINDYVTAERCLKGARQVSSFYAQQSGGRLNLVASGEHMFYPGDGWKVFNQAAEAAKKKYKADYYIVPNVFRKGGNHAGAKVAHVIQFTGWVWDHEVGHLLGLGHSGVYVYGKDGKPKLEPYNDKQSPMGNQGFKYLIASQYYSRGWLGPKGTALFKKPGQTFELTRITASKKGEGPLFGVMVKGSDFKLPGKPPVNSSRDAFISFPAECPKAAKTCVALHLFKAGGSQRVNLMVDELYDGVFTGLHLKATPSENNKIKVTVDYDVPSAVKK